MNKLTFIIFLIFSLSYSDVLLKSDPDIVSSGLEFNKTVQLMLGEEISFKGITIAGLIHVRNEKRFNQGIFPNHNWRGVVSINYNAESLLKSLPFSIILGLKHESAHPTMGICCEEKHYYEKVYDGQYRRYLLNSIDLSIEKIIDFKKLKLLFDINYHFYFYSKNTPELIGMQSTLGNGFSGGIELNYKLRKHAIFLSLFDRVILESRKNAYEQVYISLNYNQFVNYPIINSVNTIKGKIGLEFDIKKIRRRMDLYTSILYGSIYGFVDSREKRLQYTIIGIEILH